MGCFVIAQELEKMGYKTKRGNTTWAESTVMGILKNEKYKGDIRQGKTFTVDPISKRRLDNLVRKISIIFAIITNQLSAKKCLKVFNKLLTVEVEIEKRAMIKEKPLQENIRLAACWSVDFAWTFNSKELAFR